MRVTKKEIGDAITILRQAHKEDTSKYKDRTEYYSIHRAINKVQAYVYHLRDE